MILGRMAPTCSNSLRTFYFFLLPLLDKFHFFLGIIEFDMRIHIECDGNIAVSHQILQCLGAYP